MTQKYIGLKVLDASTVAEHVKRLVDLYGDETKAYIADLDDTDNHDTRISFIYSIYDKMANEAGPPLIFQHRAGALRAFSHFINTLPEHISPEDFRIDLYAAFIDGIFLNFEKATIATGQTKEVKNAQERISS